MQWSEVIEDAMNQMASHWIEQSNRVRALTWQDLALSRSAYGMYPRQALNLTYEARLEQLREVASGWPHASTLESIARHGWWTLRSNAIEPGSGMRMHVDRMAYLPLCQSMHAQAQHVLHHESLGCRALSFMLRPGLFLQAVDATCVGGEVIWVLVTQERQSLLEGVYPIDEVVILGESYEQALLGLLTGYASWMIHQDEARLMSMALTPFWQALMLSYERSLSGFLGVRWVRQARGLYDHRQRDPFFKLTESDRCVFMITARQTIDGMAYCDRANRQEWYDVPYVFYSMRHRDHINATLEAQVPDDGDYDSLFLSEGGHLGNVLFQSMDVQLLLLFDGEVSWFMYYFPLACQSHVAEVLEKTSLTVFLPQSGHALRRLNLASMAHIQSEFSQTYQRYVRDAFLNDEPS